MLTLVNRQKSKFGQQNKYLLTASAFLGQHKPRDFPTGTAWAHQENTFHSSTIVTNTIAEMIQAKINQQTSSTSLLIIYAN